MLYKIVEATDEKFKFNGAQESAFSDKCSSKTLLTIQKLRTICWNTRMIKKIHLMEIWINCRNWHVLSTSSAASTARSQEKLEEILYKIRI